VIFLLAFWTPFLVILLVLSFLARVHRSGCILEEVKKNELSLTSIEQEWSVYRDQRRLTSRSNFSEVHPNVKGWSVSKEDREKIWESLESERISDESFELAWENRFHLSSSEDTESNERVETILKEWNKIRSEELVRTLNDPGLAEQLRVLEPYRLFVGW